MRACNAHRRHIKLASRDYLLDITKYEDELAAKLQNTILIIYTQL